MPKKGKKAEDTTSIIKVQTTMPQATKRSNKAQETVERKHKCKVGNTTCTKQLLDHPFYKDAKKQKGLINNYLARFPLLAGMRCCPNNKLQETLDDLNELKRCFDAAATKCVKNYDIPGGIKETCMKDQGTLADEAEYPTKAEFKDAFSCQIVAMPIPVGFLDDWTLPHVQVVIKEAATKLLDLLTKSASKLSKPGKSKGDGGVYRDTLTSNVGEAASILRGILEEANCDDEQIFDLIETCEKFGSSDPEAYRKDDNLRSKTADTLAKTTEALDDTVSDYFGANTSFLMS
jgi:hypothetical protein